MNERRSISTESAPAPLGLVEVNRLPTPIAVEFRCSAHLGTG